MSTFVLVHGAWHDGSAWEPVVKHLEAQGHQAFAPTIAGHGKGVNKNVNHAQCVQSIVDYIVGKDLTDIVLLGHSFGGTIIAKVAEAISDQIRRLIFLDAFILNDGRASEITFHHTIKLYSTSWRETRTIRRLSYRLRCGEKRLSTMLTSTWLDQVTHNYPLNRINR